MADPYNTPPTTNPNPNGAPNYTSNTTNTVRTTRSTNWFAYLLGAAVLAVAVGALVVTGDDDGVQPTNGSDVTIDNTSTTLDPVAPAATGTGAADTTGQGAAPDAATAPAADAPAADAPAIDPATNPAAEPQPVPGTGTPPAAND